ncbi:helix-turn-helix domain-containing protein [Actinosynnema sp. NPDC020468]|uniref:TetR/AcrR family transcriptional regulator n=1 Tax=Actinosynnema sp. NPDC020468 TaxID=3154488 RepID=UPI00340C2FA5
MPKDTKARALEAARELFFEQGLRRTSLQDIADRLGITKPALYYHFSSRDDLVRSLVQPLVDDGATYLATLTPGPARPLLEGYYDFLYRHKPVVALIVRELVALTEMGLFSHFMEWRTRLTESLFASEPTPAELIRATVSIGGLSDCVVLFVEGDEPPNLREVAVDAAMRALDLT